MSGFEALAAAIARFRSPFLAGIAVLVGILVASPPTPSMFASDPAAAALALSTENPRYLAIDGKPILLVTSAEHYGAVLNLDFDYVKYLDTLARDGLNLTRTFVGAYVEPQGAFKIARNTLAPAAGRFICPWARSETPGYANGGNKFDLSRWDDAYFRRLRDFAKRAEEKKIVVEVNLFCPFYDEPQWALSPMNPVNHVNAVGAVARDKVYTLDGHGGLLPIQEALVEKIVEELSGFRWIYWEICNEPYFGGVTVEWQRHMTDLIARVEKDSPRRHLISWNIANGRAKIVDPHPDVSIFNFHYATPPDAIALNESIRKVFGDNETGFKGTADEPYRREAWEFLLAGGGLFNHLDYSFTVGHEDGSFEYPPEQPGGGGRAIRKQLRVLKEFVESFDFIRMAPDTGIIAGLSDPDAHARALSRKGAEYAIYIHGGSQVNITLQVPGGEYRARWIDTRSGEVLKSENFGIHPAGKVVIASPPYKTDIALDLRAR
jgi:hypothetical protein